MLNIVHRELAPAEYDVTTFSLFHLFIKDKVFFSPFLYCDQEKAERVTDRWNTWLCVLQTMAGWLVGTSQQATLHTSRRRPTSHVWAPASVVWGGLQSYFWAQAGQVGWSRTPPVAFQPAVIAQPLLGNNRAWPAQEALQRPMSQGLGRGGRPPHYSWREARCGQPCDFIFSPVRFSSCRSNFCFYFYIFYFFYFFLPHFWAWPV